MTTKLRSRKFIITGIKNKKKANKEQQSIHPPHRQPPPLCYRYPNTKPTKNTRLHPKTPVLDCPFLPHENVDLEGRVEQTRSDRTHVMSNTLPISSGTLAEDTRAHALESLHLTTLEPPRGDAVDQR